MTLACIKLAKPNENSLEWFLTLLLTSFPKSYWSNITETPCHKKHLPNHEILNPSESQFSIYIQL